jgi:ppGpp synthetase/RelA/SpoT-type nucleotidyltranferase
MMTDPASAITNEVDQLIELQIRTLRRESSLETTDLLDYSMRAERIKTLYQELDRITRSRFRLAPAS